MSVVFLHSARRSTITISKRSATASVVHANRWISSSRIRSNTTHVSIVYGSFSPQANALRDANEIHEVLSAMPSLNVAQPIDGTSFDFNSLTPTTISNNPDDNDSTTDQRLLITVTSSMFGQPPANFTPFAHNLLLAADTNPGCLSHFHHAVWGTGDPRWFDTFMNVPRYTDQLLEKCGSVRIHPRGEFGEPHLEEVECVSAGGWAERVGKSMISSSLDLGNVGGDGGEHLDVPWDALWKNHESATHRIVRGFTLEDVMRSHGCLDGGPSLLAKPGEEYKNLVEMFTEEEEITRPSSSASRARRR